MKSLKFCLLEDEFSNLSFKRLLNKKDLSLSFKKAFLLLKKMGNSDTKELNYQEGKCLVVGCEDRESLSYKIKIKIK